MRTKTLWIKDEYLRLILTGLKTVEVRVGYSNINGCKRATDCCSMISTRLSSGG